MGTSTDADWDSLWDEIKTESPKKIEVIRKKLICKEKPKRKSYKTRVVNYNICPSCSAECKSKEGIIYCPKCGHSRQLFRESTYYSASVNQTHNTASNGFMAFKMVGKNSYSKHVNLLKTCSNSKVYSDNNNKKQIMNFNYQVKGNKFPKDALERAHDLICQIRRAGYVYRGNGKMGIWGACISAACQANRTTKSRKSICMFLSIEERFLSQGERKLASLIENGVIKLPWVTNFSRNFKEINSLEDHIVQYFASLDIPTRYGQFIIDLIERAKKKNLHIEHDSRLTTKCVGAIYMLTTRVKSLNRITKDMIWKESNISKSTFTRYYRLLFTNHKKLKKVFKKHRIPMDNSWRGS